MSGLARHDFRHAASAQGGRRSRIDRPAPSGALMQINQHGQTSFRDVARRSSTLAASRERSASGSIGLFLQRV
jgi:hypothetical protein